MCGRFALFNVSELSFDQTKKIIPNYNISPGSKVFILKKDLKIYQVNWSMKASWSDDISIFNARSETLDKKKSFRHTERCIFIANGYFEWKRENSIKIPYYHSFQKKMMFFAGVYNNDGACIVTRPSYKKISTIHNRQPVILRAFEFTQWFDKKHNYSCEFSEKMIIYKVTKKVNSAAHNAEENIYRV